MAEQANEMFANTYEDCKALVDQRETRMSDELRHVVASNMCNAIDDLFFDDDDECPHATVSIRTAKRIEHAIANTVYQTAYQMCNAAQVAMGSMC